jgi:site-specific DNA recombinase
MELGSRIERESAKNVDRLLLIKRKAIGYRRVSGRTQKDKHSLDGQGEEIIEYCETKEIPFDTMFTDVASGLLSKQRPNFVKAIQYSLDERNGITDYVLWDLDRFTRNIEEFFKYTAPLLEAGIRLHLVVDNEEFDYRSADRWYQKLIDAQSESKRISRRTKMGQRGATKDGRHIGKPPWGYTLEHDTDEKDAEGKPVLCGRLVPDPKTWDRCLQFWRLAEDSLSSGRLAGKMNQLGIPAPEGGDWTGETARMIIKNPKYYGLLYRGVHPQSRIPGPKENAKPILIENSHERTVSFESWKRINDEMEKRSRENGATRVHSSPNPASGKMKCGPCRTRGYDSNLELHRQKDTTRLRCSRKKKTGGYDCGFKTARLDAVLAALVDRLRNHFLTEDTLQSVIEEIADNSRNYLESQESNRSGVRERLRLVRERVRNKKEILDDSGLGPRTRRSITDDLETLLTEEDELQRELARISSATEEAFLFVNDRDGIIETAMNLKTYTNPEDPEAIRELIGLFIERVEVMDGEHGVIHYDLPVRREGREDTQTEETIFFEKRPKNPITNQNCGLEASMGLGWG